MKGCGVVLLGLHLAWGERGEPHQVVVGSVGVILWEGDVDPQGYTVGKDGQQDEDVEGPQVDSQGPKQIGLRIPTFRWGLPHPVLTLDPRQPALTFPTPALTKALTLNPLETLAVPNSCLDLVLDS